MASWPEFRVIKSGVQSNKMCNFGFLLFNLELNRVFYVWIDFDQDKNGLILVKTKWLVKMVGQNGWTKWLVLVDFDQDKIDCVAPLVICSSVFPLDT